MSNFKIIETPIKGLLIIEPTVKVGQDSSFVEDCIKQHSTDMDVEFIYERRLKLARGILRGMHFQREQTQGMLVRVTSGAILSVAVDLRPDSKNYGASWSVEITAENQRLLWIPEQFAHGFLTLEGGTEIIFNCTNEDNQKLVSGIAWNDAILSIDWEFERYDIDEKYLNVSDRDKRLPSFRSWIASTLWK